MILEPLDLVSSASLVEECLQHVNLESRKIFGEKSPYGTTHNLHRHSNDTRTLQDCVPEQTAVMDVKLTENAAEDKRYTFVLI